MHNRTRLVLTALVATFALSAAVSTASARRLELNSQFIRAVWSAASPLELVGAFEITVRCAVTIEGSFHSKTLSKVCGQLVGYITRVGVTRPCSGGEGWALNGTERPTNSLPWHILYINFSGTLPRITRVRLSLRGVGFLVSVPLAGECLYLGNAFGEVIVNEATGVATELRADETVSIPVTTTLNGFCSAGRFRGTGAVTQLGSTSSVIIKLVQ